MLDKERIFVTPREILKPNEIPSVMVVGKTLPEVWENAVLATMEFGCQMPTQYDSEFDPESKVTTTMMVVGNPFSEPRIHKCIPDSFEGLDTYMREVVYGIHDDRVREGGWSYSYHDRLRNYPGETGIDQVEQVCGLLAKTPFTRRAQAITWEPSVDLSHHEPPCLQRIWCQVVKSGEELLLEMNTNWRSRDAFKAAFMNMFALTELQRQMALRISSLMGGETVGVGRYFDQSDNFHIYGSYIRRGEMEGFLQSIAKRTFEQRTVDSRTIFG